MPYYNLRRQNDGKIFTALRRNDDDALFYFSILAGEQLSLAGSGTPPYLLGEKIFATRPVTTAIPVYRAGA